MQLSKETLEILKNFAAINPGLVIKPGKRLRTLSTNRSVLADADIDETFDDEIGITDLNKFLSLLSLSKENTPTISTDGAFVVIHSSMGDIRQRKSPANLILTPPDKNVNVGDFTVEFQLPEEQLKWIFSVASVLKVPTIIIHGDENAMYISAADAKGEIVDDASTAVENFDVRNGLKFRCVIRIENLKLIMGDYRVKISERGISLFMNENIPVNYYASLDREVSEFNAE